ncbi:MAG TPA: PAS domain S-box protein [Flavisolibacter sp.]|jgi:PAS domain S-box-containing protein|nr:PAS domain S-box protein [Flavisolibacter sp.]
MRQLISKNGRIVLGIAAFCIILIALLWVRLCSQLKEDRAETVSAAIQRNANLAVALEQYAIRTINNGDAVLQLVKKEYEMAGHRIDLHKLLDNHTFDTDFFTSVAVADEKGNIVAANFSLQPDTSINISDREHFYYHVKQPTGGLYIGKPVISRTLAKAVIPLTRRINKKDGSFGGAVSVQIEPSTFTWFYAEASLRPNDIISLVAPDGTTYARRTGAVESYGENISKSPLYSNLKKAPVSNYFAADAIQGIPTFFSYRQFKQYPIIATVGASEEDILADYYERAFGYYVSSAVTSALIVAFSLLLIIVLLRRRRHLNRLKDSEAKYRSVFENSLDAILLLKPDGKMVSANRAAAVFFRLTAEELHSRTAVELADSKDPNFDRLVTEGRLTGSAQGELQFLRGDGSRVIGEVASAKYKNALGQTHCLVIIRDSTERARLQKKLSAEQKRHQRRVTEQVIRAQEREREVIGRELHDNVNQVLTTVKLYLETAYAHKELREDLLPKSITYLLQSINEIRNLSRDLSAPTLGTKSLIDSITALVEMVQSSTNLVIHFEHSEYANNIQMDQKIAIYRMVQEQLNNVIKHAKATEVMVRLSQTETEVVLSIKDNGQGFDTLALRNGIGLNNIISRAKVFYGELKIESEKGKGCLMEVSMPVREEKVPVN